MHFETFTSYLSIPAALRKQWCRMHIQEFPHVPAARAAWKAGAAGVLVLAIDDGTVVAWSMYYWKSEHLRPELYTYTRVNRRGEGHGKRVAQEAKKQADAFRPERLYATFYPHDPKALALYRSLGYCLAGGYLPSDAPQPQPATKPDSDVSPGS